MNTSEVLETNHEVELLLLCARMQLSPEEHARIGELLDREIDWPRLLRYATKHGLAVLLHRHLSNAFRERVPLPILQPLQAHAVSTAAWNLLRTRELLRIVQLLETQGLDVIPFKGPTLAASVYGDVALRNFVDLDILVRRHCFPEVKAVLIETGYEPYRKLNDREEAAFLKTQMGYEFIDSDTKVVVEVHWAFLNRIHAFHLDPELVWQRSQRQRLGGTLVRSFSPEDLLIYLCAHGAKSFWERTAWICDVAELVRKYAALDWRYILNQSRKLHGERMLFSGLYLAHDLLGAALPEDVMEHMHKDRGAARLAEKVKAHLFSTSNDPLITSEKVWMHLAMRERFIDRLPYYFHLAKLAVQSKKSRAR